MKTTELKLRTAQSIWCRWSRPREAEIGYRGRDAALELVGYYRTLRAATKAVHMVYVRNHSGAPVDPNESPAHGMPPSG
ncbi:MAG: hypothetical protein JWQ47_613 [Glaciihabitans sp.]|nr:hypothetical protein [Glaciihabitans sp.]